MARPTRYEELLDAAELVVRREGSARLTLDAVAAEAGASKGGLLYHFPNKNALIEALCERMLARFTAAHEQAMADDPAAPGRWTRAYVRATVNPKGEDDPDTTSAAVLAAMANSPPLADPLRQRYAEWRQRAAKDGLRAEDAMILALAADGLWMADLLGFEAPQGEARARVLERMLELAGAGR